MNQKEHPSFKFLREWVMLYGHKEVPDNIAVQDFVICESKETIKALRAELIAIKNGNFEQASLESFLGRSRLAKFNSFQAWAEIMLLWLAEHEKHA